MWNIVQVLSKGNNVIQCNLGSNGARVVRLHESLYFVVCELFTSLDFVVCELFTQVCTL